MASFDTIAAISTPPGIGGIAVIRLSGKNALEITERIFRGTRAPRDVETHRIIYGRIVDCNSDEIDEVLVSILHGPHTYTGEDVVEISCHGGFVPAQRILEACITAGARMAERGEFTKRAFLNGRVDLTQAEAVLDIVSAKTAQGLRSALFQRNGAFSRKIRKLKESLLGNLMVIELMLDFANEDLLLPERGSVRSSLQETLGLIDELIYEGRRAVVLREGMSAAIVGRPNVGKSSLLNALLLEERAIVTPLPGTTTDVIEGWIDVEGIPLKLYDTCGFQDAENIVEKMGIEKTEETIAATTFVLFMLDGSEAITDEDRRIFSRASCKPMVVVVNKSDLPRRIDLNAILNGATYPVCVLSAKEHAGIGQLNAAILKLMNAEEITTDEPVPTRSRHIELLSKARECLEKALRGMDGGNTPELVAFDIREATKALAEIIGEVTPQQVLDAIFLRFCIGK
jgi:tRNA modification GTPase